MALQVVSWVSWTKIMIRKVVTEYLIHIVDLIDPYVDDFAVDNTGREEFSTQMLKSLIENPDIHYFAYKQSNQIVGVIAYREPAHIVHFFVSKNHQGKGIGRCLWQHVESMMKSSGIKLITVNSSCYAEKIYKKMGFESVSEVIEAYGLRFIKMHKYIV